MKRRRNVFRWPKEVVRIGGLELDQIVTLEIVKEADIAQAESLVSAIIKPPAPPASALSPERFSSRRFWPLAL